MTKYFHISKIDLGNTPILTPKIPSSSVISKEGNIPRVCFSPSLHFCLRAISGTLKPTLLDLIVEFKTDNFFVNPTVYYTEQEPFIPPPACDFKQNKER